MTTAEMHTYFKVDVDKSQSGAPSFLPEEIDYWLNTAYLMTVNQKFTGNNLLKKGFEESEKRISDLSMLISTLSFSGPPSQSGIIKAPKPNDFLYYIDGELVYDDENGINSQSILIPVSHDDSGRFKRTKTNIPVIPNPVVVQEASLMVVFFDTFTVNQINTNEGMIVRYRYVKAPEKLSISTPNASPVISSHVHGEIVALAAFLAIENIESQRMQTNASTLAIQE